MKQKTILQQTKRILHRTKTTIGTLKDKVQALKDTPVHHDHAPVVPTLPAREAPAQTMLTHISVLSVVKSALAVIGLILFIYMCYQIQHILVMLVVSLLFAAALDPVIDRWEGRGIPRSLGVVVCYIIGLFALVIVVSLLLPMMIQQIATFTTGISNSIRSILVDGVKDIPFPFLSQEMEASMLDRVNQFIDDLDLQIVLFNLQEYSTVITNQLSGIAGNFWAFLKATFNGVFNAILVLIVTFFLVTDKTAIRNFVHSLLPARYEDYVSIKTVQVQHKIGAWARGQFILCLTVGLAVYIGLWILHFFGLPIEYKETLAVLAGVTEIIPVVGPIIGMVPAVLIAMNMSFFAVLWIVVLYFIVQQLENNVLVPIIMKHAVGLNPVVIIIVMLIGAQFFGLLGVILAIPVATSLAIFVQDYARRPK